MDLRILEIASNTENNKVLDKHTHKSKNKNSICGDEMEISLIVENNKVTDMGYQCKSCVYCQASVSLLSRNAKNKSIKNIKEFADQAKNAFSDKVSFDNEWKDFNKLITNNNLARKECLLLPINTAVDALSD